LFGSGDVLSQQLVDRRGLAQHDFARTCRMALYGGVIFAPATTHWYRFLQQKVILRSPRYTLIARVTADQCVFAPINLFTFLSSMAMLEGKDVTEKLSASFITTYKANIMIWPPVQVINFALIPLEYRVLFVNVVNLGKSSVFLIHAAIGDTDENGFRMELHTQFD
ncbi:putative integral membrane protein, Mpv17/PMP22 family, partial [Lipomyces doorenjongii]